MLHADQGLTSAPGVRNHPRAIPMAVIAFINYNIVLACIWGSFSVLLSPVEARLGVSRELSTIAAPALNLVAALCAPLVGVLATRYSLRLIMLTGSLLSVTGYAMLASTHSYPLYLAAYGLLLGPGMATGVILPGTLVTRWFVVNRGKALGGITTLVVIGAVPLLTTHMLQSHGVPGAYVALAALSVVSVIANLFIMDRPPAASGQAGDVHDEHAPADTSIMSIPHLLRSPRFWALFIAFAASSTGSITLGAHLVPMVRSWNLTATNGATLLSIFFFSAIAGTIFFGWLADRIGAVLALAILVFNTAVLWGLLLVHPSFVLLAVIIGVIGADGAGVVPVFSLALSEVFGRESFGRAYGLANLFALPFSVLCVPAAALVYTRTGSYAGAIIGVALFLALTGFAALTAWRRHAPALA
jgi:MFS family permease